MGKRPLGVQLCAHVHPPGDLWTERSVTTDCDARQQRSLFRTVIIV